MSEVRTVFVFRDLPVHVEFQACPMPIMDEGRVIEFDLTLRDLRDRRRKRRVQGPYSVAAIKLVYSTDRPGHLGLTQYLEFEPHRTKPG